MVDTVHLSRGRAWSTLILSTIVVCVLCVSATAQADNYIFTDRNADAYVLTKDYVSFSSNVTSDDILTLNDLFGGTYLWARRGGTVYVIRDSKVIRDASRLFVPMEGVEKDRSSLQDVRAKFVSEQETFDKEHLELETRLKSLADDDKSADARAAVERRLADLSIERMALEARATELESRETAFEIRVRSLEQQIEMSMWSLVDQALAGGLGQVSSR